MFFCRHPDSRCPGLSRGGHLHARRRQHGAVTRSATRHSAQWSRRFIGLKLFLALAQHGESGYAEMIEHQARMGDVLRESLKSAGWRIVNSTPLPLVCFTRDGLDTTEFLAALRERQIAWMSEARLGGVPVVRACITSFRTTEADIEWVVGEMNRLASDAGQSSRSRRVVLHSHRTDETMKRETIAIHGGYEVDPTTKAVAVPIYQTVAYAFDSADHAAALFNLEAEGFRYTRIRIRPPRCWSGASPLSRADWKRCASAAGRRR